MSAEGITAICSMLIAGTALIISLWQGAVSRTHNRLSVRPSLMFDIVVVKAQPPAQIVLRNASIGPAFLKDFRVTLDNKSTPCKTPADWDRILTDLGIETPRVESTYLDPSGTIAPNEKILILRFHTQEDPVITLEKLQRLNIEVVYKSAYKEQFTATLKSS